MLEGNGYTRMVLSNGAAPTLVMILSERVVFDGVKLMELNRAQILAVGGGVPPQSSAVEHIADAAHDEQLDDTDTEQARATRGHRRARPAAAPSQWSDLNINELKAFIRHQQTISPALRLTKPKGSELPQKPFLISQLQNFDFASHWPIAPLLTVPLVLPLLDAPFSEFDRGESEVANDTTTSPYLNQGEATSILAIGSAASLSLVIDTDFDVDLEDIGNIEDEQQQAIEEDGDEEDGKITQEIVEEGSEKSIPLNISVENHKRSFISSPIIEQRSDCLSPLYQRSCQRTT